MAKQENKEGFEENAQQGQNATDNDKSGNDVDSSKDEKKGNVDQQSEDESSRNNQARTFTQDEVNKMMANEKKQGRNSAYNALGIDPDDEEMKAMIKAIVESRKPKAEDGNAAQQESNVVAEAEHRALMAEAKAEAMMLGILPNYVEDAVALAMPKVDDENDLKSVLGSLKQKYPVWCDKSDEGNDGQNANKGTGSTIKPDSGKNGNDAKNLGARLAANRRSSKHKNSYWKNV